LQKKSSENLSSEQKMKVSASLIILSGSIDAKSDKFRAPKGLDTNGNKINGQHPKRRLQALNKFMCNWAEAYLGEGKDERFCKRYTDMINRLDKSFEREQCAFFDTTVKFGGPNPDADMSGMRQAKNPKAKNPTKSRRLRREAENTAENTDNYDACDGKSEGNCDEEAMEGLQCSAEDLADANMAPFCEADDVAQPPKIDENGMVVETVGVQAKGKMSTPNRKLKRYSTGLAKWCQRYIAECYGQRVHEHCIMRAKKFLSELAIPEEES